MTAKISDLGVAKMFNLNPLQVSRMTQTPGTPAFMPPEVMTADPKYDRSVDVFSYGILIIHMFSGRWPEPQVGPNRIEGDKLIPVTETERREVFLRAIGNNHPLIDLINRCISNDPLARVNASVIVDRVLELKLQFPVIFANQVEMLKRMEVQEKEKWTLKEEGEANVRLKEQVIFNMNEEMKHKEDESSHQRFVLECEVKQLQLQVDNLHTENQLLKDTTQAVVSELEAKASLDKDRIMALVQEREQLEREVTVERKYADQQFANESNTIKELSGENLELRSKLLKSNEALHSLQHEISTLKHDIAERNNTISTKDYIIQSKDFDLKAKVRALQVKDAAIAEAQKEITRAKEYVLNKQQVSNELDNPIGIGTFSCFGGRLHKW